MPILFCEIYFQWYEGTYTARMLIEIKNTAKKCFNKQNNHFVHAHSSFLVHFLAITQDYKIHVLWEGIKTRNINIIFNIFWNLSYVLSITIQLQEHLPTSNKCHNHDEIWNNANSVFKWCFAAVASWLHKLHIHFDETECQLWSENSSAGNNP